jgi:HSP20 family protein
MTTVKFNNQPFQKSFNSLLDELFNDSPVQWGKDWNGKYVPPVNLYESNEAFHLELNAPGRNKEEFRISVENNELVIGYEVKQENEVREHKTVRREFSSESFKRRFNLGEEINADEIVAKYENGILKLYLPKKPEVKETARQINIQ